MYDPHVNPEKYKFTEAETRVLLEDIRKDFTVFGEALEIQTKKTDDTRADVAVLKEDVALLKVDVSLLKDDMVVVKAAVKDIPPMKKDMEALRKDVEDIKKRLEDKHISVDEFEVLKRRVSELEILIGKTAPGNA